MKHILIVISLLVCYTSVLSQVTVVEYNTETKETLRIDEYDELSLRFYIHEMDGYLHMEWRDTEYNVLLYKDRFHLITSSNNYPDYGMRVSESGFRFCYNFGLSGAESDGGNTERELKFRKSDDDKREVEVRTDNSPIIITYSGNIGYGFSDL